MCLPGAEEVQCCCAQSYHCEDRQTDRQNLIAYTALACKESCDKKRYPACIAVVNMDLHMHRKRTDCKLQSVAWPSLKLPDA